MNPNDEAFEELVNATIIRLLGRAMNGDIDGGLEAATDAFSRSDIDAVEIRWRVLRELVHILDVALEEIPSGDRRRWIMGAEMELLELTEGSG